MVTEHFIIVLLICLISKASIILTKDVTWVATNEITAVILCAPSTFLATIWILGHTDSNAIIGFFHQADLFLQSFFVMKVLMHLKQCGIWHQLSRALNSLALLFLNVCYC